MPGEPIKVKDLIFNVKLLEDDTLYTVYLPNNQRITVLDRLTGFGYRDIETGYCLDISTPISQRKMWIASGDFDIREYAELSISEAINLIKISANTCIGEN